MRSRRDGSSRCCASFLQSTILVLLRPRPYRSTNLHDILIYWPKFERLILGPRYELELRAIYTCMSAYRGIVGASKRTFAPSSPHELFDDIFMAIECVQRLVRIFVDVHLQRRFSSLR